MANNVNLWPCPVSGEMIAEGTYNSKAHRTQQPRFRENARVVAWVGPSKYVELVLTESVEQGGRIYYKARRTGDALYPQWMLIPADAWNTELRKAHREQAYNYVEALGPVQAHDAGDEVADSGEAVQVARRSRGRASA